MVAEQQHAAALELVVLVQVAHAGEHGLGRGLDVVEVRQRRGHAREPLAHALQRRRPAWSRRAADSEPSAARMRSTSRSVTPVRATISAALQAGERRHRPDAAPVQGRRLEQLLDQRRTVIFFVTVVFFLACVSVIVAV